MPDTSMTLEEMRQFVRNHFEEFVNRKNIDIGDVNFAPEFVDHGADVPPGLPPGPQGDQTIRRRRPKTGSRHARDQRVAQAPEFRTG